jgi:hypothetical protein
MKVTKEPRSIVRLTWTYTVDPEEGEYVYQVVVGKAGHKTLRKGELLCLADGGSDCDHAKAVAEHIA